MKLLRLAVGAVLLCSMSAFATQARVESMGKVSTFIMDDMSIFDNPANINLYPNFLIGELGNYIGHDVETGKNADPYDPWFGGIFSLDIGVNKALSIAGVLSRKDEKILSFFPTYVVNKDGIFTPVPTPVTNFDGFLGANLDNVALGAHIYIAHQEGRDDAMNINANAFASAVQLDLGANIVFSNSFSGELTIGAIRMQYGPADHDFLDMDLMSLFARIRFFSRIDAINGHLIPAASLYNYKMQGREELQLDAGIGVDAAFDRGFFWMGFNLIYNDKRAVNWYTAGDNVYYRELAKVSVGDKTNKNNRDRLQQFGGAISFGIERNIWTDWFVVRVGGRKAIMYNNLKIGKDYTGATNENSIFCEASSCSKDGNYFSANPLDDGTLNDNVGFGIGVNIEEKLKVDATISEDLLFRNPFQGGGRLISRISASYSF